MLQDFSVHFSDQISGVACPGDIPVITGTNISSDLFVRIESAFLDGIGNMMQQPNGLLVHNSLLHKTKIYFRLYDRIISYSFLDVQPINQGYEILKKT